MIRAGRRFGRGVPAVGIKSDWLGTRTTGKDGPVKKNRFSGRLDDLVSLGTGRRAERGSRAENTGRCPSTEIERRFGESDRLCTSTRRVSSVVAGMGSRVGIDWSVDDGRCANMSRLEKRVVDRGSVKRTGFWLEDRRCRWDRPAARVEGVGSERDRSGSFSGRVWLSASGGPDPRRRGRCDVAASGHFGLAFDR